MPLCTDLLFDPFDARWPELLAAALVAEEAGFDGVWTWDHLAGGVHRQDRVLECWTVLSALASVLRRMTVGPLVLNVANRHPGMVATMAATLQEVSGGRLLLGLGAGGGAGTPYAAEQRALGREVPSDSVRRRQIAEAVGVIRRLWTGRADPFEGRYYRLGRADGFVRPDPAPPIVIGAFGPKMAELAGRVGDGINTQAAHPRLADMIDRARRAHTAAGRDPAGFIVTVFTGLDDRWLDAASPERARLRDLGVGRVILLVHPPFDVLRIRAAARMLNGAGG
jgi:alkanesulfonate monooxygenase SsuD/methylene tetrahydromethanopterin reductase-like flavin-dependent oxidoreductase (luciferase family)